MPWKTRFRQSASGKCLHTARCVLHDCSSEPMGEQSIHMLGPEQYSNRARFMFAWRRLAFGVCAAWCLGSRAWKLNGQSLTVPSESRQLSPTREGLDFYRAFRPSPPPAPPPPLHHLFRNCCLRRTECALHHAIPTALSTLNMVHNTSRCRNHPPGSFVGASACELVESMPREAFASNQQKTPTAALSVLSVSLGRDHA